MVAQDGSMGTYLASRLVAQEPGSTIRPKGIVQFWSCNKAVAYVLPHKTEPTSATRTGQYLFD